MDAAYIGSLWDMVILYELDLVIFLGNAIRFLHFYPFTFADFADFGEFMFWFVLSKMICIKKSE